MTGLSFKQIAHPSGKLLIHRAETSTHSVELYSIEQAHGAREHGSWNLRIKVRGQILSTQSRHRTMSEGRDLAERVLDLCEEGTHEELMRAFVAVEGGLKALPAPEPEIEPETSPQPVAGPVVVIACTQQKQPGRAPARELYTSPNFRLMLRAAEKLAAEQAGRVLILSALHGLIELDEELDPYDLSMRQAGAIAPAIVAEQLRRISPDGITALLPSKYAACLDKAAELAGLAQPVELFADALGIGFQRGVASAILNSQKEIHA